MTVKVSKPAINVREELADLKKPTGIAGEAMLRAETPQEQFNLIGAGRRRININGDMRVAQRGTSISLAAASAFLVDRWRLNNNVGGTVTYSRHASDHPEFPHSIKVLTTTADTSISAGNYCLLSHELEGQDIQHLNWGTASAKPLTVSFWVKSSEPTMYTLEIQTAGSIEMAREVHINSANTWEYKTVNFPPNIVSTAIPTNNALGLGLIFWLTGGSTFSGGASLNQSWANASNSLRAVGTGNVQSAVNKYFEITGLQMEVGNIATPFEHRSYGEELALCQRYFQRYEYASGSMEVALQSGSTTGIFNLKYSPKRADPSVTLPTNAVANGANIMSLLTSSGSYRSSAGSAVADRISKDNARITFSGYPASGATGDATWAYFASTSVDPYIDIEAEL